MMVAVLFARADSNYKELPDCDVWDVERDALRYPGGYPVVAHPPCRAWGALAHMSNPRPGEKDLAFFAVEQVRKFGGVLEHPLASKLWKAAKLPEIGRYDKHGGLTLIIDQWWWGHPAHKWTRLYICGANGDMPAMPIRFGFAAKTITGINGQPGRRCTQPEREHTPMALAKWLITVAAKCKGHNAELTSPPDTELKRSEEL